MKNRLCYLLPIALNLLLLKAEAQISGTVYRDYNGNGVKGNAVPNLEPGVLGIRINAFNAAEQLIASFTSDEYGDYSIPNTGTVYNGTPGSNTGFVPTGTPVRLEFVIPSNSCGVSTADFPSFFGGGSSVRFLTAGPSTSNINFGINNPEEFTSSTNPRVFVPRFIQGNPTGGGNAGTESWFLGFPYNNTGTTTPTQTVNGINLGSVWGVAYSKQAQKIFTAAFVKRHVGLGPLGTGGIYLLTPTATSFSVSNFYDMDANSYRTRAASGTYGAGNSFNFSGDTSLNFLGATDALSGFPNGLGVVGTNAERGVGTNVTDESYDPAAFEQVGKVGLGDIEISADGRFLFVMNLYSRRVFRLTLNDAYNPTGVTAVVSYALPSVTVTNGVLRPFALKFHQNKLYVGAVASGENGASNTLASTTQMFGYVFELLNPTSAASFNATPVLKFPLNYYKGLAWASISNSNKWYPWSNTTGAPTMIGTTIAYSTPILSNIDFADNGALMMAFTDRSGHQFGNDNYRHLQNSTATVDFATGGDLLIAGRNCNTGSFSLEANGTIVTQGITRTANAPGPLNSEGPATITGAGNAYTGSYGEFFRADDDGGLSGNIPLDHEETMQGSITVLKGDNTVLAAVVAPLATAAFPYAGLLNQGGVIKHSTGNGVSSEGYRLYNSGATGIDAYFRNGNGLGDIELASTEAPLEIGDRVWNDANGDGLQNADELGIAGVTLELFLDANNDGVPDAGAIGTVTTDANGNYLFTTAVGTDVTGIDYGVSIAQYTSYIIRVANADWSGGLGVADLTGLRPTRVDKISNGAVDFSDNDAFIFNAIPQIRFSTGMRGQNNHNLDFGFKNLVLLGDRVWRDDNKDGIQDVGEPGVGGVTVTLYNNAGAMVGATVTDGYGNYFFDNLPAGTYQVGFTAPPNYAFTTQTNNTDNTVLTGGATAANGSDVNSITGRSANIVLTLAEYEPNIDAGLVFNQPIANSIGDKVWFDANLDGIQDANEAPMNDVTVTLYASDGITVIATTVTDASGNYIFTGLPASTNFILGLTPPVGMLLTTTSGTTTGNATTNSDFNVSTFKTTMINSGIAGTQITGIDAGFIQQSNISASIGDRVWLDLPGGTTNVKDANEPGVPGVTVHLFQDANGNAVIDGAELVTPIASTVTDAFGNYVFNNLLASISPGTVYQLRFIAPSGFSFVTANAITNDFTDSDADPLDGLTQMYFLKRGQRNVSVDAGLTENSPAGNSSIGDYVWFDANKDGVQDATEVGVAGVMISLYNSSGTVIATTVTDVNGKYLFPNLVDGNYRVGFSNLPAGYSFTSSTGTTSGIATTNSDVNPGTSTTTLFALPAATTLTGLDAGLIAGVSSGLGSLGNKVWWDVVTSNGVQDAGEPGVPGVSVQLDFDVNGDGDFADAGEAAYKTATTNALGEYMFTDLVAGSYRLRYTTLPSGSSTVAQNTGADDAIDSDGSTVTNATGASVSTTGTYVLSTGEENLSVDLGLVNTAKGSLGNRVWFDNGVGGGTANDGIQNGTEQGVAGAMVTLVNAAGQTVDRTGALTTTPIVTTTDANGYYAFADLQAGASFAVRFSNLPTGFDASVKAGVGGIDDNRSDGEIASYLTPALSIVANTFNANLDLGMVSTRAALGNKVWLDADGDGVQDNNASEPGVAGITVTLYRPGFGLDGIALNADDALPVATMITDQNGNYLFSNLVAGTYEVAFSTLPSGIGFTQRNVPGDNGNNTNNDAIPIAGNPAEGRTTGFILAAGEVDLTVDAGLFKPRAVIGNYVWVDAVADGVQQITEPAAPGIVVSLIDISGNVVSVAITDANGRYLFPNVAAGTYSLNFSNLPNGSTFTTANVNPGGPTPDENDSDVIGSSILGIVVTTTTSNLSFDAGIVGFVTLPVKIDLYATKQNTKAVLVWNVTAERDVHAYVLERSTNGINYQPLYSTTSTGASTYNRDDVQPAAGLNYYRVRVENLDGSIEYSAVRMIKFDDKDKLIVFPNPATTGTVNVQLPESWQRKAVEITLYNQLGQIIVRKEQRSANQIETISTANLPVGHYTLKLSNGIRVETIKVQVR